MVLDSDSVHSALYSRTEIAFRAARSIAHLGEFDAWRSAGMFATRTSAAELRFLSVMVLTESSAIVNIREMLADQRWGGVSPDIVIACEPGSTVGGALRELGYTEHGTRPLAIHIFPKGDNDRSAPGLQVEAVSAAAVDEFVAVLVDAYEAQGHVARFIEAEHRDSQVQRFAVRRAGRMIAVAGMTIHQEIAVLGGAATLPAERGKGAQGALLRHRLHIARHAGCTAAVATAASASSSARNLERAGFLMLDRPAWRRLS